MGYDYGYNRNSLEEAVEAFVSEYMQREVEFIDVIEFLEDNEYEVEPEEVLSEVMDELDTMLQRWMERND